MAERHQLKVADAADAEMEDPFAELTRIMGFDPRRPDAAPVGGNSNPRQIETVADDVGIDLEQELIGELEAEDAWAAAAAESAAVIATESDLDGQFDDALSDGDDAGGTDHRAGWTPNHEDASFDIEMAADELGEELAAEVLVQDALSASAVDPSGFDREFARAMEESVEDAFFEPQQFAAEPAGSCAFDVPNGSDPGLDGIDPAAGDFITEELSEDAIALDGGGDAVELQSTSPRGELAPSGLPEDDVVPGAAAQDEWNQGLHDASEDPVDRFSALDPAAEEASHDLTEAVDGFAAATEEPEWPVSIGEGWPNELAAMAPIGDETPRSEGPDTERDDRDEIGTPYEVEDRSSGWFDSAASGILEDSPEAIHGTAADEDAWPVTAGADASNGLAATDAFDDEIARSVGRDSDVDVVYDAEQWVVAETSIDVESDDVVDDDCDASTAGVIVEDSHEAAAADAAAWRDDEGGEGHRDEERPWLAVGSPAASFSPAPEAVSAEPPAAEFSLEDELNALLGNIKAAGRGSAFTTQSFGNWSGTASTIAVAEPPSVSAERTSSHEDRAKPPRDVVGGERTWTRATPTASEDLPDFDDEAFGAALAADLNGADSAFGELAGDGPSLSAGDPLDAIAAIDPTASFDLVDADPAGGAATAGGAPRADDIDFDLSDAVFEEVPEIETVEVADRAVALADDLDIPEFEFEETAAPSAAYDDLDAEFASLLNEMSLGGPAQPRSAPQPAASPAAGDYGIDDHADFAALSEAPLPRIGDAGDAGSFELDADNLPGSALLQDDADETHPAAPVMVPPRSAERQRRGLLLAGIVGAAALVGGAGALALSFGGSGGDTPALVKADLSPVKVKPENPGGTTVPNQNSAVYESVAGVNPTAELQQEKLVTTSEEPIDVSPPIREEADELPDLAAPDDMEASGEELAASEAAVDEEVAGEMAAGETPAAQPKGEDRIEQILEAAEEADSNAAVAAVAPRKVRTMIVRPDGTLVPREEPALVENLAEAAAEATVAAATPTPPEEPAAAAAEARAAAPAAGEDPTASAMPEATASVPSEAAAPAESLAAARTTLEADAAPVAGQPVMPEFAPIAPQRPSQQPIEVVGEVKADQVAAVAPAAPAASGGGAWSVQIASQPNEAAARSTYQDLAGRYASVLAGHQVDIVRAEIAGKGTFWRVRVPADSRNDAIRLCESYKEAGGNCFVSR